MPSTIGIIPEGQPITDGAGIIVNFFRLRWEEIRSLAVNVPTVAAKALTGQAAALGATTVYTTLTAGRYRLTYYVRKTAADGVNSSVTVTLGWTESGLPLTFQFPALTLDSTNAVQGNTMEVEADTASDLTFAVAYTSNTPGNMKYRISVTAELLA